MRKIRWAVINGAVLFCLLFGLANGHNGLANIAFFWSWFVIVVSFLTLSDKVRESAKVNPYSVPQWIDVSFDVIVSCTFAYYGHFVTAAFYVFHIVNLASFRVYMESKT